MKHIPKIIGILIFLTFVFQNTYSQQIFEINTKLEPNQELLPRETTPFINLEFVDKNLLRLTKEPKYNSKNPKYGKIIVGNSPESQIIAVVLDEAENEVPRIFVDANNNQNLADDEDPGWTGNKEGVLSKRILITVIIIENGKTQKTVLPFIISRYENPGTKQVRAAFRPDYLRTGILTISNQNYKVLAQTFNKQTLFSNPKDITLGIDRNQDGIIDKTLLSAEVFWGGEDGGKPFNIAGETYYITKASASGDKIFLAVSPEKVSPKNYISIGQSAPKFSFEDLNGEKFELEKLKNKVILLDFWAMWCIPCVKNLPDIKKLSEKFSRRDFEIIGISLDGGKTSASNADRLKQFAGSQKLDWHIVFDNRGMDSEMAQIYNIVDIPLYILIDKQGVIQLIERGGGEERMARIEQLIKKLIERDS